MAKGKNKARQAPNPSTPKPETFKGATLEENAGFFPFARYTSIVGVHTTLLTFTALFLPRTTFLFEFTTPSPDEAFITSRDKPQHPFLEALTLSPVSTLVCICLGVLLVQGWWGGWVRNWAIDYTLEGSHDERRLNKSLVQKQRMTVGASCIQTAQSGLTPNTDTQGLWNASLATLGASFALHIILILFGAPLTRSGA